jgi:hypothetical protein
MMKVEDEEEGDVRISKLEWQYRGQRCTGTYQFSTRVAALDFKLESSSVMITYRVIDKDTMAVCVVEVESTQVGSGKPSSSPTIQYGHMFRINPEDYQASSSNLTGTSLGNLHSSASEEILQSEKKI